LFDTVDAPITYVAPDFELRLKQDFVNPAELASIFVDFKDLSGLGTEAF
jgi:hypothetical protein